MPDEPSAVQKIATAATEAAKTPEARGTWLGLGSIVAALSALVPALAPFAKDFLAWYHTPEGRDFALWFTNWTGAHPQLIVTILKCVVSVAVALLLIATLKVWCVSLAKNKYPTKALRPDWLTFALAYFSCLTRTGNWLLSKTPIAARWQEVDA